jgi:tRNA-specific 2-thiouridylase
MTESQSNVKAIALMSSGLDSLIAAKIVKDFGIEVHGVCFYFQFDNLAEKNRSREIQDLVHPLGISVTTIDISEEFLSILLQPQHGYGSGMNPCIDCHIFMIRKAAELMDPMGAQFLLTGEVVGQRPMSQTRPMLLHMDKVSGLKGFILRPLSAKLLPLTLPEEKRWVDRQKLYDISGRSRKRQIELAHELGIHRFQSPAGGCILTEPNYSRRLKAFITHRGKDEVTVDELKLLRLGRHFWPVDHLHVVVGRDEKDNRALEPFQDGRWVFKPANTHRGPLVLAKGLKDEDDRKLVARITARYCDKGKESDVSIHFRGEGEERDLRVSPSSESNLKKWLV